MSVGVCLGGWVCACVDSNLSIFCGKCEIEGHFSLISGNTIKCECGYLDFFFLLLSGFKEPSVPFQIW